MQRIIDGFLYEGKVIPDAWDIRKFEVNGHVEISARNVIAWSEVQYVGAYVRDGDGFKGAPTAENLAKWAAWDAADALERKQASIKRSARRAKTMCRRVIKAEAFNELLTLTTRDNQTDREVAKKQFAEWFRRMKRALGTFRFCASFEKQKRGAMHVHVATHKLPEVATHKGVKIKAWELGTRIWRDIVGPYPFHGPLQPGAAFPVVTNGLCFVGGRSPTGAPRSMHKLSTGRMASYVSKYILKDCEDNPDEKNRYSRSNGTVIPPSTVVRLVGLTLSEVISMAFELQPGSVVISHALGRFDDGYWLVTEPG